MSIAGEVDFVDIRVWVVCVVGIGMLVFGSDFHARLYRLVKD